MKKSLFCSICGNTDRILHESFCEECYWDNHYAAELKTNELDMQICLECGAAHLPSGWSGPNNPETLPTLLNGMARRWIKTSIDNEVDAEFQSDPDWDDGKPQTDMRIIVEDRSIEKFPPHIEEHLLHVNFLWSTCSACAKRRTGGDITFQFRALERPVTHEEMLLMEEIFRKLIEKQSNENNFAFVSEVREVHQGFDYKIGSNMLAESAINELRKHLVGKYDKNYRLVGEDKDGTRKYQITHLYKLPAVIKDDYIWFEEELTRILSIKYNGVLVQKLRSNERKLVKTWEELRKMDPLPTKIVLLVTSKNYDANSYEMMNLSTYETFEIAAESFPIELPIGEEVDFLEIRDELYLAKL